MGTGVGGAQRVERDMKKLDCFTPKFRTALRAPDPLASLIQEACPGVFTFNAFSRTFCNHVLSEVDQCESEPPNSMNKYGVVLKDVGMGSLCEHLLKTIVNPLVRRFYPSIGILKRYHGFIVNYDPKKQSSLDLHHDDSIVTLNVCLGRTFTAGDLVFRDDEGKLLARIEHSVGKAVLHLGSHLHQAQGIRTGKRSNLILWCQG